MPNNYLVFSFMQDFNHVTNPNQHAMSPEEAAMVVRLADLRRSVAAVDSVMNVAHMQQPKPTVTEMFESTVASPELARIIDINQRIKDIHSQAQPVQAQVPVTENTNVIDFASRLIAENKPQSAPPIEGFQDVA